MATPSDACSLGQIHTEIKCYRYGPQRRSSPFARVARLRHGFPYGGLLLLQSRSLGVAVGRTLVASTHPQNLSTWKVCNWFWPWLGHGSAREERTSGRQHQPPLFFFHPRRASSFISTERRRPGVEPGLHVVRCCLSLDRAELVVQASADHREVVAVAVVGNKACAGGEHRS